MRKLIEIAGGAAIAFALAHSVPLGARDFRVRQVDRQFSVETLDAAVGDAVEFFNDDKVVHNILSRSPVQPFDLGAQKPGDVLRIRLSAAGEIKVECAIHPRMKMTIAVGQ